MNSTLVRIFGPEFVASLSPATEVTVTHQDLTTVLKTQQVKGHDQDDGRRPNKTPRINSSEFVELDTFSKSCLQNLSNGMKRELDFLEEAERVQLEVESVHQEGRLGPTVVKYDVGSHVGSFIISNDRLGVNSQCNFGSVRASSAVFKGKWVYEVQLGSGGVMQIGWATLETKFSQEKGVGDTIDSFAFDGNRVRRWNKSTAQYGEAWQAGDIISCCINLDEGNLEFFRNGKSLGIAFSNIRRGPGVAYFPAVSLAYQENIVANFGATPLQFPQPGFSPLQREQLANNTKSHLLLTWLGNLLNDANSQNQSEFELIVVNRIFEFLGPHLHSGFVVEQSFFPFFATTLGLPSKISHEDTIPDDILLEFNKTNKLLDLVWTFLEESELKSCMEKTVNVLMNQFRSNSHFISYPFQRYSLMCLIALTKHTKTRRHLIRNILFDRTSPLMQFLHIAIPDAIVLNEIIPLTWWPGKSPSDSEAAVDYQNVCSNINHHIQNLESLQDTLLINLLANDDGTDKRPSSRALFLRKFRNHVSEVIRPGSVLHQPVQKALCAFFTFLRVVTKLQKDELGSDDLPVIPSSMFYDTSVSYFAMERLGGLSSFLYKTHHSEIAEKLAIPDYVQPPQSHPANSLPTRSEETGMDTPMPGVSAQAIPVSITVSPLSPALESHSDNPSDENITPQFGALITGTPSGHSMLIPMVTNFRSLVADQFTFYPGFLGLAEHARSGSGTANQPHNPAVAFLGKETGQMDCKFSLTELLDDCIIIFVSGVQANVEKVVSLRTTMEEYKSALEKSQGNQHSSSEVDKSIEIFSRKLDEQARHLAWIQSAVFTPQRQKLVYSLLKSVLTTLNAASLEGVLFSFVPEHFITTLVNLNLLLLNQMHPTVPFSNLTAVLKELYDLADLPELLNSIAEFVAVHFADSRIILAETKDTLTQALSNFICNPTMLIALENMPTRSQTAMVKALLRKYENRAWAQSNWMIMRIWQGSLDSFAFNYATSTQARRSYRARIQVQDEFGISTNIAPNPSYILQRHVATVLLSDQKFAVSYVNSLLNQLNWSFSEFIGLIQEIQSASTRPERIFIESRQLKIAGTCFELTSALLRVMEMICSIAAPVFDFSRESAEPLLSRLCMLLSQVLNRVSISSGSFTAVMELDIPGLENVTYFPILTAVAGILIALITKDMAAEDSSVTSSEPPPATKTLLLEPSFQISSLDFLLGNNQHNFNINDYVPEDVNPAELTKLISVISYLSSWSSKFIIPEDIDDDFVCTICYAYPQNATLKPCNHRVCRICIMHHLLNRQECFFCKAAIEQVFLDSGEKIYDMHDIIPSSQEQQNE